MKMRFSQSLPLLAVSLGGAFLLAVVGCSRAPEVPPKVVEITVDDSMKFSVNDFEVTHGQKVNVVIKNIGTSPKASMGHNWVLLALGVDLDAFVAAATEAPANDYIPAAKSAEILASTKLLGPNERDTATFNAPTKSGQYPFLCSFPGHYQIGMKGVLIVE